jgi:hypothetical protein
MKKLILPALLVGGLALLSFTKPVGDGGVKKIGNNLYEVSSNAKFSNEEQKQIIDLITKEYNLSDTQLKRAQVDGIILDVADRSWIFSKKFSLNVIEEHFLVWDSQTPAAKSSQPVINVLEKYAGK